MRVQIKRVYDPPSTADGARVLVDRLWPRGIKNDGSHIDKWLKDVAPSTALRKWFNHEPEKWESFCEKYLGEIKNSAALKELFDEAVKHKTLTILYAAKDEHHNNAVFIQQLLLQQAKK